MNVYGLMAAGQHGCAFENLARRFRLTEEDTAEAVRLLLPPVLNSLKTWIQTSDGMTAFFRRLSSDDYLSHYHTARAISDSHARELGLDLLADLTSRQDIDMRTLRHVSAVTHIRTADLERMLPFIAILMMAAVEILAEAPTRETLAQLKGKNHARSVADPFGAVAQILSGEEGKQDRHGILGMFASLFARSAMNPATVP